MSFLQSAADSTYKYARTKFRAYDDVYVLETEGLYFKFYPNSRDLKLTNNAKKATYFKFTPPVTNSPSLSPWVSIPVIFIHNTYTCKYIGT